MLEIDKRFCTTTTQQTNFIKCPKRKSSYLLLIVVEVQPNVVKKKKPKILNKCPDNDTKSANHTICHSNMFKN